MLVTHAFFFFKTTFSAIQHGKPLFRSNRSSKMSIGNHDFQKKYPQFQNYVLEKPKKSSRNQQIQNTTHNYS